MTLIESKESSTCFSCKRLNKSTFLIVEDDKYGEKPFIYAKICRDLGLIVLSDTGCGGKPDQGSFYTLRSFIESFPVPDNSEKPLNPSDENKEPSLKYLVICTHCHYDHILGISDFVRASSKVLASALGKSFIETNLPEHSLCEYMEVPTPEYTVTEWAKDPDKVASGKIQILQTPGHTPDELAWYDSEERQLYVGDSFYNRVAETGSYSQAIVFPPHGDLVQYMASLHKMKKFVKQKNEENAGLPVKVGCGHTTSSTDAHSTLVEVESFFWKVIEKAIPVKKSWEIRDIVFDLFQEDGNPRFSVQAPRTLVEEARKHWKQAAS